MLKTDGKTVLPFLDAVVGSAEIGSLRGCVGASQAAMAQTAVKRVDAVKAEALRLETDRNEGPCRSGWFSPASGWRSWRWRGWRRG